MLRNTKRRYLELVTKYQYNDKTITFYVTCRFTCKGMLLMHMLRNTAMTTVIMQALAGEYSNVQSL